MEFKVSELEREPIEFDLELAPGAVDFGEEAEQEGPLATAGGPRCIHEHRGPKDIVADIRLRGQFRGQVSGSLRALRGAGGDSAGSGVRPDFPARRRRIRRAGTVDYSAGDGNRLLSKRQSFA